MKQATYPCCQCHSHQQSMNQRPASWKVTHYTKRFLVTFSPEHNYRSVTPIIFLKHFTAHLDTSSRCLYQTDNLTFYTFLVLTKCLPLNPNNVMPTVCSDHISKGRCSKGTVSNPCDEDSSWQNHVPLCNGRIKGL